MDYHPPLGGFVLLSTALAAFGILRGEPRKQTLRRRGESKSDAGYIFPDSISRRWATGALTGTVPLCLVANAWCFPLQGLLVAGCLIFLWYYCEPPRWEELIGTSLIPWLLLYPCLAYLLTHAVPYPLGLVKWNQHTPFFPYLLQFWPILGLVVLAWFASVSGRREYRWFALMVAAFLVLIETLNVDDIYSGHFERFNTAFKWSPWVAALALLLLAPLNLADRTKSPVVRVGTVIILLCMLCYTAKLGREWQLRPKPSFGQLDGAAWLRNMEQDAGAPQNLSVTGSMLNYLQARPGGVILEPPVAARSGVRRDRCDVALHRPLYGAWMVSSRAALARLPTRHRAALESCE